MKKKTKSKKQQTPLMRQYFDMKSKHPDAILLFRVGDFYETFGPDAIKASKILGIVLTKRNNGSSQIELAGFPHHSLDLYLPKLVRSGHRVAICEQLEKPSKQKKIVKRGITDLVTPGVTIDDKLLNHRSNNYLAALHFLHNSRMGLAILDISTGEFYATEGDQYYIDKMLRSFDPTEIIVGRSKVKQVKQFFGDHLYSFALEDWVFSGDYPLDKIRDHFDVKKLKGFGLDGMEYGQIAAGAILHYLEVTENKNVKHIQSIQRLESNEHVWLDRFTIRNLELTDSLHDSGKSLLDVLDHCATAMGARLLKKWILFPLRSKKEIENRLSIVDGLQNDIKTSEDLYTILKGIADLERLISKVSMRKANPKEILHISKSLGYIPEIKEKLKILGIDKEDILSQLSPCKKIISLIENSIHPDAPITRTKGQVIADGFNDVLDDYRATLRNSKDILVDIQKTEAKRTGIDNLKIGFNNVFGYYLEVTNKYKDKGLIPDDWIRKQTLTNSERYITEDLKTLENKILEAQDKIAQLENELYEGVLDSLSIHIHEVQRNAETLAQLDVLLNFSRLSIERQYARPTIHEDRDLDIRDGRHPVIELELGDTESYIPNDLTIEPAEEQILLITGPNMSGKSALLRQTALIVLMAQIGSHVPASAAHIGLVDKIFTRVGASDNISSGESTFMVEMSETASIMNNMSSRSLIILDEIGRGTSTYDGVSLAWSIAEYLHTSKKAQPKTLFATHYHELNQLGATYPRIKNYHISVKEKGQKVIFLRKLIEGGSEHSFGIHVAKMAGMPPWIVKRAYEMLRELESHRMDQSDIQAPQSTSEARQLDLFSGAVDEAAVEIKEELLNMDINQMTPIEALMKLNTLRELASN